MTDPYEQDRKDLADPRQCRFMTSKELAEAVALFLAHNGCSDFVLPDFLGGKALAFGSMEFIRGHLASLDAEARKQWFKAEHERLVAECSARAKQRANN